MSPYSNPVEARGLICFAKSYFDLTKKNNLHAAGLAWQDTTGVTSARNEIKAWAIDNSKSVLHSLIVKSYYYDMPFGVKLDISAVIPQRNTLGLSEKNITYI